MVCSACRSGISLTRVSPAHTVQATRREVATQNFADRFMLMPDSNEDGRSSRWSQPQIDESSFFRILEMAVKKIAGGAVGLQPMPVQQKIMHVVGENELFDFHAVFAEARDQIHGLRKIYVAVVVAVDEEHRRLPSVHGGHGRRIVGELVQLR